jgi:cyanophycin synthetase
VIEVAKDCAVLNADDPLVLKMAGYTEAKSICYVTINPQHGLVREHIRAGGRACALEAGVNGQMITLYDRSSHIPLVWTHLIPATLEGRALHNVQNAMFAAAMAYSLGIKLDAIRRGLRTFDSTFFQAPGRMNVFNEHPFKVLFDYGHNAHAVAAMADLAQRLEVTGRRIVVLAGPGDRRDEDLRAIADAVAGRFDHYICRRDDSLRDRGDDEVPKLQAAQLQLRGVPAAAISIIPDEQEAIEAALNMGQAGDLLLVFADALIRSWKQITKFKSATSPGMAMGEGVPDGNETGSGIGGFMTDGPAPVTITPTPVIDLPRAGSGSAARKAPTQPALPEPIEPVGTHGAGESADQLMPGLIRDERGVWIAPETED